MSSLFAHLLPALVAEETVAGGVAVVFDILRATTTIVHAMSAGARKVIPTLDEQTAMELAKKAAPLADGRPGAVTGGERRGLLIPGFDLDNNPFAYTPEVVGGRTVVFTTSNGTKAMLHCRAADVVYVGAFVNLSALVERLSRETRPIHLVGAGTMGKVSLEDCLAAGAVGHELFQRGCCREEEETDDQLGLAVSAYRQAVASRDGLLGAVSRSFGGRNCTRLGFTDQIARAATVGMFEVVPVFDPQTGEITA
jgi:2-phosphosulfolactate phosphatase